VYEEHQPVWDALTERNWATVTDERVSLIGDGVFYTPLIQTLLGARRAEALKRGVIGRNLLALS
jgi:oxygen-independent coproporphyrinogen-3 oxidase